MPNSRIITQVHQQENNPTDESPRSITTSLQNINLDLKNNLLSMEENSFQMDTDANPTRQKRALQSNFSTTSANVKENNMKKKEKSSSSRP